MSSGQLGSAIRHELNHLQANWWWFAALGALLVVGGTAAIVFPQLTVLTSFAVTVMLGILLMVAGAATIVGAFWAGKWSGFILQLLVGILYVAAGVVISDNPETATLALTRFIAIMFVVLGVFRSVVALQVRFPQWGWGLLNGLVTLLAGIVIYRHLPEDAFWVIGLLVGLEMLFNGWTWIMLALAIRSLPREAA